MSFAPPVSRDGFHYNGDLYVEVGNLNRHKRASVAEITDLLRPNLKKGKVPGKDAFGHWYEAQLIHYGLPPSKDKARAKMRLLEALNASALAVPPVITKLEESLRKEYDVAERKAKALYKASTANSAETSGSSKKRKRPEATTSNSTTVNVNVNFGGFGGMPFVAGASGGFPTGSFTQQQDSPPPKKARTSVAKAPTKKPVNSQATNSTGKFATKQTARSSTGPPVKKPPVVKTQPVTGAARKSTGPPVKKLPVVKAQPATEKTPKKEPAIKKESAIKKEPAVKKEPLIKREPGIKNEPGCPNLPALGLINGWYDISCPEIESDFHCGGAPLTLILCLDTPRVWGCYSFGPFKGIWHLPQRPYQPSEDPLPFHWRGRKDWRGEMCFGEDCRGEIAFLGDGRIEGWIENHEFTGTRRPGPTMAPRSANSMREEWEGYNEEASFAEVAEMEENAYMGCG